MAASIIPLAGLALILLFNPKDTEQKKATVNPKPSYSAVKSLPKTVKGTGQTIKAAPLKIEPAGKIENIYAPDSSHNVYLDGMNFNPEKEYQAIYKYITSRYRSISKKEAEDISNYLVDYGKKHNIDPKFAAAVIARESAFNRKAISKTGAKGLGQIKDFNFKSLKIEDPYDIKQNISGTTKYLNKLVKRWDKEKGTASLALASYFKGPNAVRRAGGKYDSKTDGYVKDILKNYEAIKAVRSNY